MDRVGCQGMAQRSAGSPAVTDRAAHARHDDGTRVGAADAPLPGVAGPPATGLQGRGGVGGPLQFGGERGHGGGAVRTGLALLETHIHARAPVRVGDTIGAEVVVTGLRPTSSGNRAVVTSGIRVTNQRGETVMDYTVTRLLAGRP